MTWLKRPTAELVPLLVVCSTILLSGCIRLPGFDGAKQAEEPPVSPPVQAPKPAERLEVTGLTPLPTTDQLLASMPIGRNDPFAPQPRIGLTASPEQAASVGGQPPSSPGAQARSGATRKRPAPLPFCAGSGLAALLPPGWTVAAIDVERGRLTLRQGSRSVTAEL